MNIEEIKQPEDIYKTEWYKSKKWYEKIGIAIWISFITLNRSI